MIRTISTGMLALALIAMPQLAGAQDSMKIYNEVAARATKPDQVIRYGPDDLRSGELRLPKGKGPFPLAVLIHGGCWDASFETVAGFRGMAEALTKRGFATWSIEYRRVGDAGAGWPGTFEDVSAGIDHAAALAKTHPLDLKRVTFVGHSAGAHLALWGASRPKLGAAYAPKIKPVSVVAIDGPGALVPFVGVDSRVCGKPVIVPFMGGTPESMPEAYKIASPAEHLPLGVRQLLVKAAFTPFMQPYEAAARASGDSVEVLQATTNNHFGVVTPGTPDGDKVIDFIVTRAFAD